MFWKKKDEPKPVAAAATEAPAKSAPPAAAMNAPPAAAAPAAAPARTASPAPAAAAPAAVPVTANPQAAAGLSQTVLASNLAPALGKAVSVLLTSSRHQGLTLREMSALLVPALISDQYVLAEAKPQGQDVTAPVGLVVWASVSDAVDQRLSTDTTNPTSPKPEDWRSGSHVWVIDMVGNQQVVDAMVKQLKEGPHKGQQIKFRVRGADGRFQTYSA